MVSCQLLVMSTCEGLFPVVIEWRSGAKSTVDLTVYDWISYDQLLTGCVRTFTEESLQKDKIDDTERRCCWSIVLSFSCLIWPTVWRNIFRKMKSQADHSLDQELQTGSKQVQNLYIVCKDSGGQRTMMLGSCISLRGFLIWFEHFLTFASHRVQSGCFSFRTVCPHWGVLAGAKGPGLDQGMLSGPRLVHWWELSHKSSVVRCPCAFRLCRLAQNVGNAFCLFWRSRFTSAPCSFFELYPFCVAGVRHPGHFEV